MFPSAVVSLVGATGKTAGYATGTAQEVAAFSSMTWNPVASVIPTAVTAISTLQATMLATIKNLRSSAETSGVLLNGNVYPTDACSQAKYPAVALLSLQAPTTPVVWWTSNNGYIATTAQAILEAGSAVTAYVQSCYAWEQSLIASVQAATTAAQLAAINLTTNMPQGTLPAATTAAMTTAFPMTVTSLTAGSMTLTGAATVASLNAGSMTLTNNLTCSGVAACAKYKGGSAAPALTRGNASGTTSTVTLTTGSTDSAGQISVATAGTVTTTSGTPIVTLTFSSAYTTAPFVSMTPSSVNAANLLHPPYVTATTTGFSVYISGTGLVTATTYTWNYMVMQ